MTKSQDMKQITGKVKWYNPGKGFGFVTPTGDENNDAFLHISTLNDIGKSDIIEGTELTCEVIDSERGLQITKILKIVNEIMLEVPPTPGLGQGEIEATGIVKWFKPHKGFGFALPDDGTEDIFLHKSVLRKCGIKHLFKNQRVSLHVTDAGKGREATWIALL